MSRILIFLMLFSNPHSILKKETDETFLKGIDPDSSSGAHASYTSSVIIHSKPVDGPSAIGSGNYFKIRNHRFVITAHHVIEGAKEIRVFERSSDYVHAKVVLVNLDRDYAVLMLNERLSYTKPSKYISQEISFVGEQIYHCGHPNENYFNLSEGVITNREKDFYVTNASAWPGSSGSVVFSEEGEVVGVISSIKIDLPYGIPQLIPYMTRIGRLSGLSKKDIVEALLANEN